MCPWFFADSVSLDQSSCPSAATATGQGGAAAAGAGVWPPWWGDEEEVEGEEEMFDTLLASLEEDPDLLGCTTDPGHVLSPRMP